MNIRLISLMVLSGLLSLALSLQLPAQEQSTAEKPAAEEPAKKLNKFEKLKLKIRKIGDEEECEGDCSSTQADITMPAAPPVPDYSCASGNCSCAGAKDCIEMKDICAPNTMTCNDYGCTCAEKPAEPDGGG